MAILQLPLLSAAFIFGIGLFGLIGGYRMSPALTTGIRKFFLFLCAILIVLGILAFFDIYIRGYWTTKVLAWIFIITASLLFAFGERIIWRRRWRIFTGIIYYFPPGSVVLAMLIPLFIPLLAFTFWLPLTGDRKSILYNDPEIRIQAASSIKDFEGWPRLYQKKGIWELDKGEMSVNYFFNPDSLTVEKNDKTIIVKLYKSGFEPVPFVFRR